MSIVHVIVNSTTNVMVDISPHHSHDVGLIASTLLTQHVSPMRAVPGELWMSFQFVYDE